MPHLTLGTLPCILGLYLLLATSTSAREIYVNNQTGSDQNPGTAEAPLRSARRAVAMADAGDVIHLLPERAVYREMITLSGKREITIEGHDCVVSGADPLPADSAEWEKVSDGLHRIRLQRTTQDRHVLVVDGKGVTMGRTKYQINPLAGLLRREGLEAFRAALRAQYPKLDELKEGQFAWEPIDASSGWLYVKGSLKNLEWAVRSQCIYTTGEVQNVTIRNLHARHALNDGYNIHGNTQGLRLFNVSAHECFDNGISPHGACSFTVQDGQFLRNEMAVGNDFLTQTHFLRCTIADSVQEEVMVIGGQHVFEDCTVRCAGPVGIRLVVRKPTAGRPLALREIQMSGKDVNARPQYTFRRCTIESADSTVRSFVIGAGFDLTIERCQFKSVRFQVDPDARVTLVESTLDGQPLTQDSLHAASQ